MPSYNPYPRPARHPNEPSPVLDLRRFPHSRWKLWLSNQQSGPGNYGPLLICEMLVTVGVHSGQRSKSLITAHTRSDGASMSTEMRNCLASLVTTASVG